MKNNGCKEVGQMRRKGLTGNQLKIIALITMTLDHVGVQLFPECQILRIIGRIAFPIFAYMIAEGCKYTKDRKRYYVWMAGSAALCQAVYYATEQSLYQCVLVTFSLSILLIYSIDLAKKYRTWKSVLVPVTVAVEVVYLTVYLPIQLAHTGYWIDYGIGGVCLPVVIYLCDSKWKKLIAMTGGLAVIAWMLGGVQWYLLIAIPLLVMYNGKRGRTKLKYLFYVYYPLHLAVIYGVSQFVQ